MDKLDYIAGVSTYFRSQQWQTLTALLQQLDQRSHIHLFVNTSIHPESLEAIVKGYLRLRGWGVNRGNEILSPGPNRDYAGTVHGVHPRNMPHFDMNWRFRSDAVLAPMEEANGEQGKNILYWDETYMDYFYRNYEWRSLGAPEERAIHDYFESKHWHHSFELIQDPEIVHIHPVVQTSIHPGVLEKFVTEAVARKKGWKLHRIVPNVFRSNGIYYGKLMMLFDEPDLSFDLSWLYDRDTILAPSQQQVFSTGDPAYFIVWRKWLAEVLAQTPHRILSEDEIAACLRAVEDLPVTARA